MPKNAFLSLATLGAIFSLAVHLYPSVAELKAAASVVPASAATVAVPKKTTSRPRRIRLKPVSSSASSLPTLVLDIPQPKSLLEKILDGSGVKDEERAIVGNILGLLDAACLEKLETFVILYDNPKQRGLAGKGVILVSGQVGDQELTGLLLHEGLGHFRDITCLTGTPQSGVSAFKDGDDVIYNDDPSASFYRLSWENDKKRKAEAKRDDFVTGYAYQADNFEDLAESVTYYMTQEQTFRMRAEKNPILAQKLAWLETYMPKTKRIGNGSAAWDGKIAWDATKLGFTWIGN